MRTEKPRRLFAPLSVCSPTSALFDILYVLNTRSYLSQLNCSPASRVNRVLALPVVKPTVIAVAGPFVHSQTVDRDARGRSADRNVAFSATRRTPVVMKP